MVGTAGDMKTVNIGLIGFGNIGTGVVRALAANGALAGERTGAQLRLARIADVDTKRRRDADYDPAILTADAHAVTDDPAVDIVIELIGGLEPARSLVERALRAGKHVVTANKAMLATFGPDLLATAHQHGAALLFEASVGGGIPIIRALQTGLSANRIRRVFGIVNGTCNYILTSMADRGKTFDAMLAEAQANGYAEPDPTYDIEGYDTAHKTAVLAQLAFGQDIRFADVHVEGITKIAPVDIEYARELGYTIKLLGIAKHDAADGRVEVRVHPTLLPRTSLLASVGGVFNAVMVEGDLVGKTMFYGRGAGQDPTASAVLSDVMSIAADLARGAKPGGENRLRVAAGRKALKPIAELEAAYYLRIPVLDRAGVMARLSAALGSREVSINSMIQKANHPAGRAEVIIVTHTTRESVVQQALAEIAALETTVGEPFVLRVEDEI
jgi:homoserine dehydrogenase